MNNEIQRKITSLTLMTIMLAGGMTFAIPGEMPQAFAVVGQTANLYVSSVTFGGPMILEVIVSDPQISETDESNGMPSVTIDGHDLVMAQGDDGNWYAYVADTIMAAAATEAELPFGDIETAQDNEACEEITTDSSNTIYCDSGMVKKPQSLNRNGNVNLNDGKVGSIDLPEELFPFIQTFVFTEDSDMDLIYDSGIDQVIEITYTDEMDEFASFNLDRASYPHNADIHLIIDDMQLNLDPTDEDIWTFDVSNDHSSYGEGQNVIDLEPMDQNNLNYGDNGFLSVDYGDGIIETTNVDSDIVIVEETLPNSGLFENTDSSDVADLKTTTDLDKRGQSGVIEYNDMRTSVLVNFFGGSIDMDVTSIDGDWNSGEPMVIVVTDEDANTNTKLDNDFDVSDAIFKAIPTIKIGSPLSLNENTVLIVEESTTEELESERDGYTSDIDAHNTNIGVFNTKIDDFMVIILGFESTINEQLVLLEGDGDVVGYLSEQSEKTDEVTDQQLIVDEASAALLDNPTGNHESSTTEAPWTLKQDYDAKVVTLEAFQGELDIISDTVSEVELIIGSNEQRIIDTQSSIQERQVNIENQEDMIRSAENQIAAITNTLTNGLTGSPLTVLTTDKFSSRIVIDGDSVTSNQWLVYFDYTIGDLQNFITGDNVYSFINYDLRSIGSDIDISVSDGDTSIQLVFGESDGFDILYADVIEDINNLDSSKPLLLILDIDQSDFDGQYPLVIDFMRYGGEDGRINDAIYRLEAEETSSESGEYIGTVEYIMLNQIDLFNEDTFSGLATISDELEIIVHEDLTDEDAVSTIYLDVDAQGVETQVSDQEDAPTYSGSITFDQSSYKVADTVTVILDDADLNTDGDTIDIYTVIDEDVIAFEDNDYDEGYNPASLLFDVTINDSRWITCGEGANEIKGLSGSMNTFVETDSDSGLFAASFQIPSNYCATEDDGTTNIEPISGNDIEVNYQDFRDASGESIETGDSAGIRANTGSISLDRTVYPVPWGTDESGSIFKLHASANGDEYLENGDLTIHVRINDPDFDISANGEDKIAQDVNVGPVTITVSRGGEDVVLATAGAKTANPETTPPELGPITEIAPDAGIFELDMTISYTDGPSSSMCPVGTNTCILQGDILQVVYDDPTDASGSQNSVTDSATFDLRNGVLQSDKSVYLIGSDMIMTLIEPDFDLDNDQAESYSLDLIEWDSDAATTTMGSRGSNADAFDPEPSTFRETGDSTGIFQVVIEIPEKLDGDRLERGEEIVLEYTDWGPSGAKYVGDEDEDINLTLFTSNFGATVELDQKVYTWTDKVYITIVAPDHNFDSDMIDEIGNTDDNAITVSTRSGDIDNYKLVETGGDTGIFTGEVILTGFKHDADGDGSDDVNPRTSLDYSGPTDGFLESGDDDGLTVSFEFSDGETTLGSALIRWNIGEVQWLEASYPASGTGVTRIIDPDMNLDPEAVDNFDVDVWSDSDAGGIALTVTETNEATGIFEGTVFFTTTDESSGHRLRVAEGDTVTAEYEDNTLPDPYTTADELDVTATTLIGTLVPPLERAPAANLRTVDAFGNSLDTVTVDQQVQLSADLSNNQEREQTFAYLVQIQNSDGVTVSLAWITGSLTDGQSFSPALSWIPEESGSFTATAFVWESVDNPTALSPPVSTTITVS